ncbi:hypothetical protein GGTG_06888 [Gaeumannomyces tritici R3-111a-1]|uniref:Aminoglycoside phosphotransferase domain-containing protein n=1 Tax=Gaeumannomyces tritici (strain R3-111a-1) TaxID=644352 RepID=J3P041_GAET3|nr:hypothetical protein GGTG_06888 [Gaeumannomyces tritici R3-111a-1]EJT76974.1 hypothetical protein GGTG_06888 [Gaeumannomyces tritici R3-111a-1]
MAAQHGALHLMETLNWDDTAAVESLCPSYWGALKDRAIRARRSLYQGCCSSKPPFSTCTLLPKYNRGGVNLVRLVEFDDGERWVARIKLHGGTDQSNHNQQLVNEVDTLMYIRENTTIPVPQIFAFDPKASIGFPFVFMEFILGNTAMDAFGGFDVHGGEIPEGYKPGFMRQVATVQTEIASVRLPKIGRLVRQDDGSYDVGPFPDLGGPFSTAAEYFKARAEHAKFPRSEMELRSILPRDIAEEITTSIRNFPSRLAAIANHTSLIGSPFPLYHTDFHSSNIVVDPECNVLSVIDWENASTVPWEVVQFPLFLSTVPPPMDAPQNYDDKGQPKDSYTVQLWDDRNEYVRLVREAEVQKGPDRRLSTTLANRTIQNLAGAVKLFLDPGKIGFYNRVLDQLSAGDEGSIAK